MAKPLSGMTAQEELVYEKLNEAMRAFRDIRELPLRGLEEFGAHLDACVKLLQSRALVRQYPAFWTPHKA